MVDIGDSGCHSDGGVFPNFRIGKGLEKNEMSVSSIGRLPASVSYMVAPYVLVGDDAFPLKHYLMKPYQGKFLADIANIYNFYLSSACGCVKTRLEFGRSVADLLWNDQLSS